MEGTMKRQVPLELLVQAEQQRKAAEARAQLALRLNPEAALTPEEAAAMQAAYLRSLSID
jgi:hypothetical protein